MPPPTEAAEKPPRPWSIAGEYRLAVLEARPGADGTAGYGQQLNRLRLKVDASVGSKLSLHLENDFDVTTGSYLRSDAFRETESGNDVPRQYWSARVASSGRHGYQSSSNVYRGYLKLDLAQTDITLGRQRIPLGTGYFWSALDMLNPPNPLRIESDEVLGVDALRIERKLGDLDKADLIFAPDPDRRSNRWVAQYRGNFKGTDVTFTYGRYWQDDLAGVDVATQIGSAGVRGEWALTRPLVGRQYQKVMLAWDYAWANSLTLSFEGFYNGQRAEDRAASVQRHPQLRFAQPAGSAYAGTTVGFNLTPLWRVSTAVLVNLRDHSRMVYPSIGYSYSDNLSMLFGGQLFHGGMATDFGAAGDLHFLRLQYYF